MGFFHADDARFSDLEVTLDNLKGRIDFYNQNGKRTRNYAIRSQKNADQLIDQHTAGAQTQREIRVPCRVTFANKTTRKCSGWFAKGSFTIASP